MDEADRPETRIRARHDRIDLGLRAAWRHRGLLRELMIRNVRLRYRSRSLGLLWALLQPLLLVTAFGLLLGHGERARALGMPYISYALPGFVIWMLFANGLTAISQALVASEHLLDKVYFPRLVITLAALGPALLDFVASAALLAAFLAAAGQASYLTLFWLLPSLLTVLTATLACGLLLSVWMLRYRDLRALLPFGLQVGLLVSPVAYSAAMLHEGWRHWLVLNPLAPAIHGFRHALLGSGADLGSLLASLGFWALALLASLRHFRWHEHDFADYR